MKYIGFILLIFLNGCFHPMQIEAQDEKRLESADRTQNGMHAAPWAFGKSADRRSPIWAKGTSGKNLLPKDKKAAEPSKVSPEHEETGKHQLKSSLGLSFKEEAGTWKVTPSQKNIHPDEMKVRENKHVLGAYADVEAAEDFNIRLGPELIIKDDSQGDDSAYSDQPDSAWGLGMKFQYDF